MGKSVRQQMADIDAKIEKLQVERAALEGKVADEVDTDLIQAGAIVSFLYGKGDNKTELTGQVLGRKNAEPGVKGGDFVKVAVGEGFDADVKTVGVYAVTKILPQE